MRYQVCQGATVNAFIYQALLDASYLAGQPGEKKEALFDQQEAARLKPAPIGDPASRTRAMSDGNMKSGRFSGSVTGKN
jgi:hypothetical protein